MILNDQFNDIETYKKLGKYFREITKKELETGGYAHLTNPDNKNGIKTINNIEQLIGLKCRFSIMPREKFVPGNGNSTNIGHNEIILAIYGNFKNKKNINKGFTPQSSYKARFILGENFRHKVIQVFANKVNNYFNLLERGNYEQFVENAMKSVNDAIDTYKSLKVSE